MTQTDVGNARDDLTLLRVRIVAADSGHGAERRQRTAVSGGGRWRRCACCIVVAHPHARHSSSHWLARVDAPSRTAGNSERRLRPLLVASVPSSLALVCLCPAVSVRERELVLILWRLWLRGHGGGRRGEEGRRGASDKETGKRAANQRDRRSSGPTACGPPHTMASDAINGIDGATQ